CPFFDDSITISPPGSKNNERNSGETALISVATSARNASTGGPDDLGSRMLQQSNRITVSRGPLLWIFFRRVETGRRADPFTRSRRVSSSLVSYMPCPE